ncbi:MAG: ABC transporter substrate-binding protein [Amphritea sp.]
MAAIAATTQAGQISDDAIKVGFLSDMSGPYSASNGPGALEAAKMAIEDVGSMIHGKPITLVHADDQNKPDIGSSKAREWLDVDNVDVISGSVASSVTLAVTKVVEAKNKIILVSGSASSSITNEFCSPNSVHWVYDTYALSHGTGKAVVEEGLDTWYFLTADYAFGHALEQDVSTVVKESGGQVLGAIRHPFPTSDFSSFILQAQASGARVIGLANAGTDTINALKAAHEFGVVQSGQQLAGLLITLTDIHALGLEVSQGLNLTTGFYWDRTPETRAWSKRFYERTGKMPTQQQAGVYSSLTHYFKAVEAVATDDTEAVISEMKKTPVNDFLATNGKIREDGRMVHDMYLARVKQPSEASGDWDLYEILRTIPGDQAFRPLSESQCKLIKNQQLSAN